MKTKRAYQDYIRDVWTATLDIEEFVKGKTYDEFRNNKMAHYAVRNGIGII